MGRRRSSRRPAAPPGNPACPRAAWPGRSRRGRRSPPSPRPRPPRAGRPTAATRLPGPGSAGPSARGSSSDRLRPASTVAHRFDGDANTSLRYGARCICSSTHTTYASRSTEPCGNFGLENTARRHIAATSPPPARRPPRGAASCQFEWQTRTLAQGFECRGVHGRDAQCVGVVGVAGQHASHRVDEAQPVTALLHLVRPEVPEQ